MDAILLFRLGGLGDLLVALPSVQLVKKRFPGSSLSLVCRTEYGRLLEKAGVVDTVFPLEDRRWLPLFDDGPAGPEDFKKWLAEFNFILGWFQRETSRPFERKIFDRTASRGRFIVYEPQSGIPVSRYFFDRTSALIDGRPQADDKFEDCQRLPSLKTKSRDKSLPGKPETPGRQKKSAVIHPGSGNEKKCWPLENFLAIISFLHQKGIGGFLITGEAEARMERKIVDSGLPPGWSWLRRPPLVELAGLLEEAAVYLGNDSGVTHLAAACGAQGLALFRKDMEVAWKPFGRINVLSAADIATITVESVIEKIGLIML
jgi:ADP-heptose:LPS heptosyltransferase